MNAKLTLSKKVGSQKAIRVLTDLMQILRDTPLSKKHVLESFKSNFKDKEDGLQHFACLDSDEVIGIITRNLNDWKESELPVYTPKQILEKI